MRMYRERSWKIFFLKYFLTPLLIIIFAFPVEVSFDAAPLFEVFPPLEVSLILTLMKPYSGISFSNFRRMWRLTATVLIVSFSLLLSGCASTKHTAKKKPHKKPHKTEMAYHLPAGLSKIQKNIIEEALSWENTPYGYGRSDKGKATDCSGLVLAVYRDVAGVMLPRNSAQQADFAKSLKKKDVRAADLVFFATGKDPKRVSHVGIMLDEDNFIHASTSKGVVISSVSTPYYQRTFMGFGRVL